VRALARFGGVAVAACVLGACGGRSPYWNAPANGVTSYGMADAVALVDDADHRVVLLTALAQQNLQTTAFTVGHHVTSTATSADGQRLFVLSSGDQPRRTAADEQPSLTVITVDPATFQATSKRYEMSVALPNLAIDPQKDWAVAYAGSNDSQSFVQNPNEIVIFDLDHDPSGSPAGANAPNGPNGPNGPNPASRTLQSFGGTPQRLTFTPVLELPASQRRLLVIESDIDVTLLDLTNSTLAKPPPEITVRLTSGMTSAQLQPAGVVVDGFDPTSTDDARIALRAVGDREIFTFTFGPPVAGSLNDFAPILNLTDVGGVPSDFAFVRTSAASSGLRVAALVPSTSSAVFVDPDSSVTTQVALPAPYSSLSLVTNVVNGTPAAGTDVALLWNAGIQSSSGVALWSLELAVGQPYFSVEVLGVTQPIQAVDDVSPPNQRLKVLETASASSFIVLDLGSSTASPLNTASQATLALAPDGERIWAFAQGGTALDQIPFANLNPVEVTTTQPIRAVYDVARPPAALGGDGGRSLIAIHDQGAVGATVFDALAPDTATSRVVPALVLEGP
jgi:hypothetical protein